MTTSQLGSTVESVLSLIEKMTTALQWDVYYFNGQTEYAHLRSSSLSELRAHIDSIRTEIASVILLTRKIVVECTVQIIRKNMEASLSKMELLSHQLCQVTKVKVRHCQGENLSCLWYQVLALILNGTDQSEETAALVYLVENGANLLRVVDCLLRDIHTLSGVSGECTLSESGVSYSSPQIEVPVLYHKNARVETERKACSLKIKTVRNYPILFRNNDSTCIAAWYRTMHEYIYSYTVFKKSSWWTVIINKDSCYRAPRSKVKRASYNFYTDIQLEHLY